MGQSRRIKEQQSAAEHAAFAAHSRGEWLDRTIALECDRKRAPLALEKRDLKPRNDKPF